MAPGGVARALVFPLESLLLWSSSSGMEVMGEVEDTGGGEVCGALPTSPSTPAVGGCAFTSTTEAARVESVDSGAEVPAHSWTTLAGTDSSERCSCVEACCSVSVPEE